MFLHLTREIRPSEFALLHQISDLARDQGVVGGMLLVNARQDLSAGIKPEIRAGFEELINKNNQDTGASAVVFLAPGFGAAVARTVIAQLMRLRRNRASAQVFGSVTNACRWLGKRHQLDPAGVEHAYLAAISGSTTAPPPGGVTEQQR